MTSKVRFDYEIEMIKTDGSVVGKAIECKDEYGVNPGAAIKAIAEVFDDVDRFRVIGYVRRVEK